MENIVSILSNANSATEIIYKKKYSIAEINQLSGQVAYSLSKNSIKKYDRVGIQLHNSIEFVISFFAILKLGAVAVLISPEYPVSIKNDLILENQVKFLIDQNSYVLLQSNMIEPITETSFLDPAVILFTSGTTSKIKPIVICHNHLWTITKLSKLFKWSDVRMLLVNACYHMSGLSYLETAIFGGAKIYLENKFDTVNIIKVIEENDINFLPCVPSMIYMLLDELGGKKIQGVKYIRISSAPVSQSLYYRTKSNFPNAKIDIIYGSTEGGPSLFGKHPHLATPDLSVGYPIKGIEYKLINEILFIKSPGMSLMLDLDLEGFYNTKDIFEIDDQGFYYFKGRSDNMFTCGGHNIYPSAIEHVLEKHPDIDQAVVVPIEDKIKGSKPYAFVKSKSNELIIIEHCKKYLRNFEIPRKVWRVDKLPLNSLGKIDIQKLKEQALEFLNIKR